MKQLLSLIYLIVGGYILCQAQDFESDLEEARHGDYIAQWRVGLAYELGNDGVDKNDSVAFYWYQKCADLGYDRAQARLAYFYENGRGTEVDYRKAFLLYRKAAMQGMSSAQKDLGICYELGRGVAKDLRQAVEWCKKAVESGSKRAAGDAERVSRKFFQASSKAAKSGQTFAERDMGLCYERGIGVQKSLDSAAVWYRKATDSGVYGAGEDLDRVMAMINLPEPEPEPEPKQEQEPEPKPITPLLKVGNVSIDSDGDSLQTSKMFYLTLYLENFEQAAAEDVTVKLEYPDDVLLEYGEESQSFESIKGKETKELTYQFFIRRNYSAPTVPLRLKVHEKHGMYAEDWSTDLALGQPLKRASDVDCNIPQSRTMQKNTYVMIVAEENYKRMPAVEYAKHDAEVFREYCIKTLGIPQENIVFETDITKSEFVSYIDLLKKMTEHSSDRKKTKVIFYYSGHGMPDKASKTAYLFPYDGYVNNLAETAVSQADLYSQLEDIGACAVTLFLDACFSGYDREGSMIEKGARGVVIADDENVGENTVVFAAARGNQSAYSYKDKQHGMFTYFLLKKLQESQGEVTYGELSQYITQEVGKASLRINQTSQTPQANSGVAGWEQWKLK